jgi:hypothetical protein
LQIDLQEPLVIDSASYSYGQDAQRRIAPGEIKKDGNAYFINANNFSVPNTNFPVIQLTVYYHGKPQIARRPPWDGGLIWKKDKNNNPYVSIACQAWEQAYGIHAKITKVMSQTALKCISPAPTR